ncbi:glycosyltransferase family 4 protein [Methanoculleus sp. 7T]|uniref:glycosyltransferase family 4 protein n=1 Tax=Methanoculleus sp. 7T TaxID=2937282 RepID=UPI0020BD8DCF|nr:glycosyltransferase family 4 protein [Methanoculleus sp. 7T]
MGGVEIVTHYMAKELSILGHEVHIVTSEEITERDEDFSDDMFSDNKFYVHRLHLPFMTVISHNSILKSMLFIFTAFMEVRKIRPDIIHAQNFMPSIPAYLSKIFFNIPYAICVHTEKFNLTGWGIVLPLFLKKYWPSLPYIKHSDMIFALTDNARLEVQKYLNKNSITVPNGVDLDLFKSDQLESVAQSDIPKIACISRLEKGKGIECALHAMRLIVKRYPNSKLIIIGDGLIRQELENLTNSLGIKKNVEFIGEVPNYDIPKYLASVNIYLLTSFREGFSMSLLEAMAFGLPVISTPVGIAQYILNGCNNGYLVPIRDPHAICEAVVKITENPEIKVMFSKNSAEKAKEYSWSKIIKQYEKGYYKIIYRDSGDIW